MIAVNRKELVKALTLNKNITGKRQIRGFSELENTLLEVSPASSETDLGCSLVVHATNLDQYTCHNLETLRTDADSLETHYGLSDKPFLVNTKTLLDIVKASDDVNVTLSVDGNNTLTVSESARIPIKFDLENFPSTVFDVAMEEVATFSAKTAKRVFKQLNASASVDETRYHLNGIYFDSKNSNLVATDGHRMSVQEINFTNEADFIAPTALTKQVSTMLSGSTCRTGSGSNGGELSVLHDDNIVCLVSGPYKVFSRVIAGKYPNYQQLIPQNIKSSVTLPVKDLVKSLKTLKPLINTRSKQLMIDLSRDKVSLTPLDLENQQPSMEVQVISQDKVSEEGLRISLNCQYMLDYLTTTPNDSVTLGLVDKLSPVMYDENYVQMPMRF